MKIYIRYNIFVLLFSILFALSNSRWSHQYSTQASIQLSQSIKIHLINNIDKFSNNTFSTLLQNDLNENDDKKRKLKEIDGVSVSQLFMLFNLPDVKCKFDNDGFLRKDGLKCLSQIWKNYLPPNIEQQ